MNVPRQTNRPTDSVLGERVQGKPASRSSNRRESVEMQEKQTRLKKQKKQNKTRHTFLLSSDPDLQSLHRVAHWRQQVDEESNIGT